MLVDVFKYSGAISMQGYEALVEKIDEALKARQQVQEVLTEAEGAARKAEPSEAEGPVKKAVLVIGTPGGDPDAGFRIARALQHHYEDGFDGLVPRYCKSAGTMTLLGASTLIMANCSELGPLDIQIKKDDELYSRNSGQDINQAVNFLKAETLTTYRRYTEQLVRGGLSTRMSADISVKLVQSIFNPIASQIDPLRLAEMQRATSITMKYGNMLAETSKNVITGGVSMLVGAFPSHSFVIDRKEARKIFKRVLAPTLQFQEICDNFEDKLGENTFSEPVVEYETIEIKPSSSGENHANHHSVPVESGEGTGGGE